MVITCLQLFMIKTFTMCLWGQVDTGQSVSGLDILFPVYLYLSSVSPGAEVVPASNMSDTSVLMSSSGCPLSISFML